MFGDLLLVQCGRFIKYQKVDKTLFDEFFSDKDKFTNLHIDFDKTVEISKIWSTKLPNVLQIVAKDNVKDIFMILTWDFKKNIEVSML